MAVVIRHHTDFTFLLTSTLDMILKMTGEVYSCIAEYQFADLKGEEQKQAKDKLNVISSAIDNGLVNIVTVALAVTASFAEPKIALASDGSVTIKGQSITQAAALAKTEVNSPTLAAQSVQLVMRTARLAPDLSSFIRASIVKPIAMAKKAEKAKTKALEAL
jgi:hypothetical protein